MKVIIAGGRNFVAHKDHLIWLEEIHGKHHMSEVVNGAAPGADTEGATWARYMNIPVRNFPADWNKHGRAAGPIRNRQMAQYLKDNGGGLVVLFPGGVGTDSMRTIAREFGLKTIEWGMEP